MSPLEVTAQRERLAWLAWLLRVLEGQDLIRRGEAVAGFGGKLDVPLPQVTARARRFQKQQELVRVRAGFDRAKAQTPPQPVTGRSNGHREPRSTPARRRATSTSATRRGPPSKASKQGDEPPPPRAPLTPEQRELIRAAVDRAVRQRVKAEDARFRVEYLRFAAEDAEWEAAA